MKLSQLKQTEEHKNSNKCTALEYTLDDKDINVATIILKGRYPDQGRVMNLECKEICYILEGEAQLHLEEKIIPVNKGDVIMIEPGEKYYWEGEMTMFVPCVPAWTPEQHKQVA